jgi:HAD superfamily hydrolase (TIGR01450 family)
VAYVTNNASRTTATVAQHLRSLGLDVTRDDIVTSPQAAVGMLAELVPAGSTILVVGGEGLREELANAGFRATDSARDHPAAVIQGFAEQVGWAQLAEAAFALQSGGAQSQDAGIPWVATNTDWTLPTERGLAPGNGTLVSAVHSAVGRLPVVAGKPEAAIFEVARRRYHGTNALFLGDRMDTDIVGANRAGMSSALVLTGVDHAKQVLAADRNARPTYLLADLRQLHEPYPVPRARTDAGTGDRLVTVGTATVRMAGTAVSVVERGARDIDVLRAAAHLIWDSGLPIYGLDVAAELYE